MPDGRRQRANDPANVKNKIIKTENIKAVLNQRLSPFSITSDIRKKQWLATFKKLIKMSKAFVNTLETSQQLNSAEDATKLLFTLLLSMCSHIKSRLQNQLQSHKNCDLYGCYKQTEKTV